MTYPANISLPKIGPTTKMPAPLKPSFGTIGEGVGYGFIPIRSAGTFEEWIQTVIDSMIDSYLRGDQNMLDQMTGATGPIGQPNRGDFGTRTGGKDGTLSVQTYRFFENYAKRYWDSDPYIKAMFGDAPSERAEWTRPWLTAEEQIALKNRDLETQLAIAQTQAAATLQATAMRVGADLQIAEMENATRRYIAEGEWGLQRELARLNEAGLMTRFLMELGLRRDELVLKAQVERNRHHESMLALITEIAKYDAQLASEPRNWVAYAAWLKNRGMVVNGLTLGAAVQAFQESDIDPGEYTNTPGGQSLGGLISYYMGILNTMLSSPGSQPTYTGPTGGTVPGNFTYSWQAPNWQNVGGNVDYTEIANKVLPQQQYSQQEMQQAYSDVDASGGATDTAGYWAGPTENAIGMRVNPLGHKNRFEQFFKMNPAQQQMNIGAAASVGRYDKDYIKEFTMATPRGRSSGGVQYG